MVSYYFLDAINFFNPEKSLKQKEELYQMLRNSITEEGMLFKKIEPIREPEIDLARVIKVAMKLNFADTETTIHLSCPEKLFFTPKRRRIKYFANYLRSIIERSQTTSG